MDKHLLLLSHEADTADFVRGVLEPLDFRVTVKSKLTSGLKQMGVGGGGGGDLVLLALPESLSALKEIKSYYPDSTVIVSAERKHAAEALDVGAFMVLDRPFEEQMLRSAVRKATQSQRLRSELEGLKRAASPVLMQQSVQMQRLAAQVRRLSASTRPVLLRGEEGSGKSLLASMVHRTSPRSAGPFVSLTYNPEGFEAEFFGRVGAAGRLLSAEGGTIYIRRLEAMPEALASRFASFLQTGEVDFGSGVRISPDVRVVASAGTVPLPEGLAPHFAELVLPPLRERKVDILPLAEHFLAEASVLGGGAPRRLSEGARKLLLSYGWPGNAGELKSVLRRAVLLSTSDLIEEAHIAVGGGAVQYSVKDFLEAKLSRFIKGMVKLERSGLYESVMGEVEKALIELVLAETEGNQVRASGALGITRTTLRSKLKAYSLNGHEVKHNSRKGRPPKAKKR